MNSKTIALVLICFVLAGCHKTSWSYRDGQPVTVKLDVDGDFDVSVDQAPLTRAGTPADAYGINVYYDKEGNHTFVFYTKNTFT